LGGDVVEILFGGVFRGFLETDPAVLGSAHGRWSGVG
jgi:hypothetical protein